MEGSIKETGYVIDASFVLNILLPDENSKETEEIFRQFAQGNILLESTYLLPFEVANALFIAVKRKRIIESQASRLIESFLKWNINFEDVHFPETLQLAVERDISVYDASYLWLAGKKRIKLLTLDKKLLKY